MSVGLVGYTGAHGYYGARVFDCVRVVNLVTKVYEEQDVASHYGVQSTLHEFMRRNHGHEGFVTEDDSEEDCLVILASFAPGGSEWGEQQQSLEDVGRFYAAIREAAKAAAEEQAEEEEDAARWRESSACNQARGGW